MKKKPKKKIKQKLSKSKKKKTSKLRKKNRRGKIKKKIKKFKKLKKIKSKKKKKTHQKIIRKQTVQKQKNLKTAKQRKYLIKLGFQKVINFMLYPIFRAYDDFRERRKIEKLKKIASEKKEKERQIKEEERLGLEAKKKELQFEKKLERERKYDLKKFIQEGQALLRKEQAEKKRKLYESMQIQKRLDQFRKREEKEIANLERYALKEQIAEYHTVQDSIDRIRKKYQLIRESKIRAKIESLGIEVLDTDTKEDLFQKQKEFEEQRKKVEIVLESFFRSAQSLIFQLNRRWIPKNLEILRVIDRRWEENLFYIRFDNEIEDNWLMLIYLEDANPDKQTIVVEDKTSEKYLSKKFNTNSIFSYSDWMVDRWTEFLDREFKKKTN